MIESTSCGNDVTMDSIFKQLSFFFISVIYVNLSKNSLKLGGLLVQAVRYSPPTAGVPSSRLGHSMWVSWLTKRGLGMLFSGFLPFFPYHKCHSAISPHSSRLFHFISFLQPLWCCVVCPHPRYSLTFNIGASSHLISRPGPVSDTSWGRCLLFY